jgi:uncharacterized membrane protein
MVSMKTARHNSTLPTHILKSGTTHHPIVMAEAERRASKLQLRVADGVTAFAGSMRFVYLHAGVFALWMILFEASPWPTLTLVVSLEAIFLSTFVMIGQNRQAAFQQVKADHDFAESEKALAANTKLTTEIHRLTQEIHRKVVTDELEQNLSPVPSPVVP